MSKDTGDRARTPKTVQGHWRALKGHKGLLKAKATRGGSRPLGDTMRHRVTLGDVA
jgi:hypothetical protein